MNGTIVKIGIIALAILVAAGAKYVLHLPDNNPIEKIATEMIDKELSEEEDEDGFVTVDLSA